MWLHLELVAAFEFGGCIDNVTVLELLAAFGFGGCIEFGGRIDNGGRIWIWWLY